MSELTALFIEESLEFLRKLELDILDLEKEPTDDLINSLFRDLHSFKGRAATLSFEEIAQSAHNIERIFSALRDKKTSIDEGIIELLFEGIDHIRVLLDSLEDGDSWQSTDLLADKIHAAVYKEASKVKKQVLVVDDNVANRIDLQDSLSGFDVTFAANSIEALWGIKYKKAKKSTYELVFFDDAVDDIDDVLGQIEKCCANSTMKIYILTDSVEKRKSYPLPSVVNGVIEKPIDAAIVKSLA